MCVSMCACHVEVRGQLGEWVLPFYHMSPTLPLWAISPGLSCLSYYSDSVQGIDNLMGKGFILANGFQSDWSVFTCHCALQHRFMCPHTFEHRFITESM